MKKLKVVLIALVLGALVFVLAWVAIWSALAFTVSGPTEAGGQDIVVPVATGVIGPIDELEIVEVIPTDTPVP